MSPYHSISSGLDQLCRGLAILGGGVLVAVMVIVVVSVSGRALIDLGLGPIPGDFELVEVGTAIAVFSFLPWCQLKRGHVSVDVLQTVIGRRGDAVLSVLYNLLMTGVAGLILWRLWAGMQDKITYSETTFILQFPVWWGYAACVPIAGVFVLVSAWTVVRSVVDCMSAGQKDAA